MFTRGDVMVFCVLTIVTMLTATCGSSPETMRATPSSAIRGLPNDWSTTQVRTGMLGQHTATPSLGFTIDLPPGWIVGERWPEDGNFFGWLSAPPVTEHDERSTLSYTIGRNPNSSIDALREDPRYEITELEILGARVVFKIATSGPDKGVRNLAYYEQIPGAPVGVTAPRLDISWTPANFGLDGRDLLEQILKSIRYKELTSLPDIPPTGFVAPENWARKVAGADSDDPDAYLGGAFSLRLPPGWTAIERRGIDFIVGEIAGDGIKLAYLNPSHGSPDNPPSTDSPTAPRHLAWEEVHDGVMLSMFRPVPPDLDQLGKTGVMFRPFVDGPLVGPYASLLKMTIAAEGLSEDQQELVLAIFRTLKVSPK